MRIAITSQGPLLTSRIDPRFARARYFIVYDTDSREFTAHDNDFNVNAVHGAGLQAAQDIANLGVEAVITGNVGPKAFSALQAGNVAIHVGAIGTVKEAITAFETGELPCAIKANVQRHWA